VPKKFGKELGIFVLLIVLCVIVATLNHRFLSVINFQNMSRLVGEYGIFGIGAALVIITGGIDLTVGSMLALLAVVLSIAMMEKHIPAPISVLIVLAIAAGLGSIHAFLITKVRLQPFIVTLCGLLFYRGLTQYIANDQSKGFGDAEKLGWLYTAASGSVFGIPTPFLIMLVIAVVVGVGLHRSVYGRYLYAVGRNEEAARYSGIQTKRIIAGAYIIAATLTGIAAILIGVDTGSISPSVHGSSYELYGIAAAVLGGCSLQGGEGSIIGVILGTALLQVLQNLVTLLGIPSSLNFAVLGAVILIGVIADRLLRRNTAGAG
jgi:ribose transport system permease protein